MHRLLPNAYHQVKLNLVIVAIICDVLMGRTTPKAGDMTAFDTPGFKHRQKPPYQTGAIQT